MFESIDIPKISVLGVDLHRVRMAEVLALAERWLQTRDRCRFICTPNADLIMKARKNERFRKILNGADLSVPDGMAVVYASRILGEPLAETVSGRLLAPQLCRLAAIRAWSIFFLGGQPGAAEATARQMCRMYPGLRVAGFFCPAMGFSLGDAEDADAVARVRSSAPDILMVGFGAPKQEMWIIHHMEELKVPLAIGVGYTFDVLGGLVRTPPSWMNRVGLEWLYRLTLEPRRLWRRYLLEGAVFMVLVATEGVRRRRKEKREDRLKSF